MVWFLGAGSVGPGVAPSCWGPELTPWTGGPLLTESPLHPRISLAGEQTPPPPLALGSCRPVEAGGPLTCPSSAPALKAWMFLFPTRGPCGILIQASDSCLLGPAGRAWLPGQRSRHGA